MRPAHVIEITTPKKYLLNGLWFGPKKPKRVIIWVHGLGSSAFSKLGIVDRLLNKRTAVMVFNNRGHSNVARIARIAKGGKSRSVVVGAAHETFEDCVDDIQGAINAVRKTEVKEVYLAGHSTGCQKSIYWAYRKGTGVRGTILLAPMSDYAGAVKQHGTGKIEKLVHHSMTQIRKGKGRELIPASMWKEEPDDAYRFISLYTPTSIEQSIFSYFDPRKPARFYNKIRVPVLVLLAGKDEYADRPAEDIAEWFEKYSRSKRFAIKIIPNAQHSFKGAEKQVARLINAWILNH